MFEYREGLIPAEVNCTFPFTPSCLSSASRKCVFYFYMPQTNRTELTPPLKCL
jgi:hypothetical protein